MVSHRYREKDAMKKAIALVVVLAGLVVLSAPVPAQGQDEGAGLMAGEFEWDFSIDIGQLYFREDFYLQYLDESGPLPIVLYTEDLHQEFDTYMTRVNFTAGDYDFDGLEYGLNFSILGTANQDDLTTVITTPYVDGAPDVPNIYEYEFELSADVHGFTIMPEVGVGGELADGLRGALLFGYGYRRTEIERAFDMGGIDTNYDVHYLNFKASLELDVPNVDGLTLLVEPEIAPVIGSKRTGDMAGSDFTIRGESGVMFSVRGQARYDVKDNIRLVLGVFYDLQQLDGGTDNDPDYGGPPGTDNTKFEWDDSLLQTVGATLGVEFLF